MSELCEIDEASVMNLLTTQPTFVRQYLTIMGSYAAQMKEQHCLSHKQPVAHLTAKALLKDFQMRSYMYNNKKTVSKALNQEEWAIHLGTTRESVSRVFRKLESSNIIAINSGSMALLSELGLVQFIVSTEEKSEI